MKKKPVNGDSKPGFWKKLFGKKFEDEIPRRPELAGLIVCPSENNGDSKTNGENDIEEVVRLEGDVPALVESDNNVVEVVELAGDVPVPTEELVKKPVKSPWESRNNGPRLMGKMVIPNEDDK